MIVDGKRYKLTGSGHTAGFGGRWTGSAMNAGLKERSYPEGTWISSVIAANGRRLDMPTAIQKNVSYSHSKFKLAS